MTTKKVLAVVGGREVTQEDVDNLLRNLDQQTAMQFNSEQGRLQLVEELINQELLYLDAMAQDLAKEEAYLAEVEKIKENYLKQYALGKLLNTITIDDNEAEAYYNENPDYFQEPETIQASHILVEDEETANQVLAELKEGLDFAEAAQKYSTCPSKSRGGDLGFFGKGQMVPEFEETAFDLDLDTLSEPVKTQFGHHIIKVVDKKEAGTIPFADVKAQIEQQLAQQKQHQLYSDKINALKEQYEITRNA